MIKHLLTIIIDNCQNVRHFFHNKNAEEVYLRWASWIFLVWVIFIQILTGHINPLLEDWFSEKVIWGGVTFSLKASALAEMLVQAALMLAGWIIAIELSTYLNEMIISVSQGRELRFLAYEKIGRQYYLKESYIKCRGIFKVFVNGRLDLAIICVSIVLAAFSAYGEGFGVDFGNMEERADLVLKIIGYFIVWGKLSWEYLSGPTYREGLKIFEGADQRQEFPFGHMHRHVAAALGTAVCSEMVQHNPVEYGINYPDNPKQPQYSELFRSLMNEEHILIENCFYREWENAFILPMHALRLRDRKIIIFSGPTISAESFSEWIDEKMEVLLGIPHAWKIGVWDKSKPAHQIEVVPYGKIPEFIRFFKFQHSSSCGILQVMLEPSRCLAEMRSFLEEYVDFLEEKRIEAAYCFADRHMDGLLDYLSHIFRCRIRRVEVETAQSRDVYLCTARNKDDRVAAEWWDHNYKNSCDAVAFGELINESQGELIYVSENIVPVRDFWLSMKGKLPAASDSGLELPEGIDETNFRCGIWDLNKTDTPYILADDDYCNYYDLYRYLSQYGEKSVFIFILTERYLLLEFMLDNEKRFLNRKFVIPVWFPVYQDTDRNRLLKMIRRAGKTDPKSDGVIVERKEITALFPAWADNGRQDILCRLNDLAEKYYGERIFDIRIGSYVISSAFLRKNAWLWEEVKIVDESGKNESAGCILYCQLYQKWLEGQYISRGGYCYRVGARRKGKEGKEIPLKRSNAFWEKDGYYDQERKYFIKNVIAYSSVCLNNRILMERCSATVSVHTDGWRVKNWEGQTKVRRDCSVPQRMYRSKDVLFVCFSGKERRSESDSFRFWKTLAVLMEGMARTLYPFHYNYLGFLPRGNYRIHDSGGKVLLRKSGLFIIEDAEDDIGLLDSVESHMEKWLELCLGYCCWKEKHT